MLKIVEAKRPTSTRKADLSSDIATVTPDIARAWLDQNAKNRKPTMAHIKAMARDMKNGKWRLTGDAIRFSVSGNLIDGQHRLMACIEAGTPFTTIVLYGLPDDAQQFIDLGKSRSAADYLSMDGFANANQVQAAARLLLAWKNGHSHISGGQIGRFTVAETLECVRRHPALAASVRISAGKFGFPSSVTAVLHYAGTHLIGYPDRAEAMLDVLRTGVPDYPGDPIHRLRDRFLRSRHDTTRLIPRNQVAPYCIHAWNAFARRTPLEVVKLPKEVFIKGLKLDML
jgi:hypothetical protein